MLRALVLAMVASVALSSSLFAGGGGTKKDATFKIINDSSNIYAVVIDASNDLISKVTAGTATINDLNAAGGKLIQPGKDGSFSVKAGTHRIGFVSVSSGGTISTAPNEATRTAAKGKTVTYKISEL